MDKVELAERIFFFKMLGHHEVCGSNLAHGKFQNSNPPDSASFSLNRLSPPLKKASEEFKKQSTKALV
jgi:hypothetical protein